MKLKYLFWILITGFTFCQIDTTWTNTDTTTTFLITFNKDMSEEGLLDAINYSIEDSSGVFLTIFGIGIFYEDINGNVFTGNRRIIIITKRADYKKTYKLTVNNIKDSEGKVIDSLHNSLHYYFIGFEPHIVETPTVNLTK